jgi:hypothetical protein
VPAKQKQKKGNKPRAAPNKQAQPNKSRGPPTRSLRGRNFTHLMDDAGYDLVITPAALGCRGISRISSVTVTIKVCGTAACAAFQGISYDLITSMGSLIPGETMSLGDEKRVSLNLPLREFVPQTPHANDATLAIIRFAVSEGVDLHFAFHSQVMELN